MKYNREQVETSAASVGAYACKGAAGCWLDVKQHKMFLNRNTALGRQKASAVVLVDGADWLPERL